jgi:hypothetical protein
LLALRRKAANWRVIIEVRGKWISLRARRNDRIDFNFGHPAGRELIEQNCVLSFCSLPHSRVYC